MPGAASFTSSRLRSVSAPKVQLRISFTAHGFGARFKARAMAAPQTVWMTKPARMKVTMLEVTPESASSAATPRPAPAMAAAGRIQVASPAAPR